MLLRTAYKVSHRFFILEVLCPVNRDIGGVDIKVYAPNSSEIFIAKLSDKDIKLLTGKELQNVLVPTARRDIYESIFPTMTVTQWKGGKNIAPGQRAPSLLMFSTPNFNSSDNKPILIFPSYSSSSKLGLILLISSLSLSLSFSFSLSLFMYIYNTSF